MNHAITVEHLTKVYEISHKTGARPSLRETLERRMRALVPGLRDRALRPGRDADGVEQFKALDDVSFEVKQGDRLAVIGQNGAGKSTLLKILSRITEPTAGRVVTKGRIASLLEVGTGFHAELTGRENIFLSGAVLGMPRSEILSKFDEIVAFSEIEQFLDTPVKYYSSGMYVRLAFAVAAHLDPEILILDEVLAVGDLRFQQKCLERMQYAGKEGRTVLFVSHNMQSVAQICPSAVLLVRGKVLAAGVSADVIKRYIGDTFVDGKEDYPGDMAHYIPNTVVGDRYARLLRCSVRNPRGAIASTHMIHEAVQIDMEYEIIDHDGNYFVPNFHVYSVENVLLFVSHPKNNIVSEYDNGKYRAVCNVPAHLLNEGVFKVTVALSSWNKVLNIHFAIPGAVSFQVIDDLIDVSYRNGYTSTIPGLVRPRLHWDITRTA